MWSRVNKKIIARTFTYIIRSNRFDEIKFYRYRSIYRVFLYLKPNLSKQIPFFQSLNLKEEKLESKFNPLNQSIIFSIRSIDLWMFFIVWSLRKKKNHFTIKSNAYKFSSKYFSISSIVSRLDSVESIEMGYRVYEPSGYPYPKY